MEKYKEAIEFEVIEKALGGDVDAINQVLFFFQPFINARCRRKVTDEFGQTYYALDEYMKRRLETKLITKILDFKIQI